LLDNDMKEHIISEFNKKNPWKTVFYISAATWEWVEELTDYLIDTYAKDILPHPDPLLRGEGEDGRSEVKVYDLKDQVDPKRVTVESLWEMKFQASWERLEQIVRMTDFENSEAVLRVYDVLQKMMVIRDVEKLIKKEVDWGVDNAFFFEGNDEDTFAPMIYIAWKEIPLDPRGCPSDSEGA